MVLAYIGEYKDGSSSSRDSKEIILNLFGQE